MTEPIITCPKCRTDIRLTESLLSQLIEGRASQLAGGEIARLTAKLAEAQQAQAAAIEKERLLEDQRRELELTVQKKVQEQLAAIRDQAKREAEEQLKLRVVEKDTTIASLLKQIEDLKRRAEQGSQQLQGEAQELELEAVLRAKFPLDAIEPVAKGKTGADVLQRIAGGGGAILWESKRTKEFSDKWLAKLRADQREAQAEVAILVTQVLPKGVETFELVDGVWVVHPSAAIALAVVLRHSLLEVHGARQASQGQQTKMELVYQYLTGPRFRQRVEAMLESFKAMRQDLEKEEALFKAQWAKRRQQLGIMIDAASGMYGDLQGIAGQSLQKIQDLELPGLPAS
jgi:hypothetical protein